jgi:predicted phosphodiesterase
MKTKGMTLAYCSDTHLDFWVKDFNPYSPKMKLKIADYIKKILNPKPADVLVVAGDIGHYNQQNLEMLVQLKEIYNEVIIVEGNHDMYLVSKNIQKKYDSNSNKRTREMRKLCEENGIIYLDGETVEINGIKIGGTGMWYNLPTDNDIQDWKEGMNDFRLIMNGPINQYSSNPSFNTQYHYKEEVKKLESLSDIDVFVSHVSPVIIPDNKRDPRYGVDNKYNKFYESDNFELLKATGAKHVIFGHTHIQEKFNIGDINFYISAIGYPQENKYHQIEVIEL